MSAKHEKIQGKQHYRVSIKGLCVSLLLVVSSVASILTQSTPVSAVGSMYITPASSSVAHDGTITLNFRINPTTAVTVVEGTVGFNPASLQFVSVNSSASPFDATVQQTVSASSVKIARAKLDSAGISTDALIASVTFKALPYSGSSPVTLTAANAAYDGAYTNPSASGATVNFTPGSCPAGQTGTPPSCTTPAATGTTSTPTPTKTNTPTSTPQTTTSTPTQSTQATPTPTTNTTKTNLDVPAISNETGQYTMLNITATTNIAAQVRLVYGTSEDNLNVQTSLTTSGKTHSLSVAEGLTPGTKLFYKIVATDGQSTKETTVRAISLKGMSAKVGLLDKNMKAIANQKVTLLPSGTEATSDGNGSALFSNIAPGEYIVQLAKDGKTYEQHITILANTVTSDGVQTSEQQLQAVVFDGYIAPVSWFPVWGWYVGGAIVALAALVAFGIRSWRKNGIVRDLYARVRDYRVNQKLKGVALGGFAPAAGTSAIPDEAVGSKTAASPGELVTPAFAAPVPTIPQTHLPRPIDTSEGLSYESIPANSAHNNTTFDNHEGQNNG